MASFEGSGLLSVQTLIPGHLAGPQETLASPIFRVWLSQGYGILELSHPEDLRGLAL